MSFGNYVTTAQESLYNLHDKPSKEVTSKTQEAIISPKTTITIAQAKKEDIEKVFGKLFSQYNYFSANILADLSTITGINYTDDEVLENISDNQINNLIQIVKKAFYENYDSSSKKLNVDKALEKANEYHFEDSVETLNNENSAQTVDDILTHEKNSDLSQEEKILNYFKTKLNEYTAHFSGDNKNANEELKKDFYKILLKTTDDSKRKLLFNVAVFILKDSEAVIKLFKNINDKNIKAECTKSIDKAYLVKLSRNKDDINAVCIAKTIIANMSLEDLIEYKKLVDNDYKNFYNSNIELIESVISKRQNNIPLDPDSPEKEISEQLDYYFNQYGVLQVAIFENKNLTKDEQEDLSNKVNETLREYPTYQLYLESLAQFVNDNRISLNIAEDKLKQLTDYLDKATDGKYSEAVKTVEEKNSAIDSETGGFKLPKSEEKEQKQQAVQELKNRYIVQQAAADEPGSENQPETFQILPIQAASSFALFKNDEEGASLLDIVKNKIDFVTNEMLNEAAKDYKQSGIAEQFKALSLATGKIFEEIFKESDVSLFEQFLSSGQKCKTFALTNKLQTAVDEAKKNDEHKERPFTDFGYGSV